MKIAIPILLCGLLLSACSPHDKAYYSAHPQALERAIRQCDAHFPQPASCDELRELGAQLNRLAYELRYNQQQFGHEILALQQARTQEPDRVKIIDIDEQLQQRLAVVSWLASPGSLR